MDHQPIKDDNAATSSDDRAVAIETLTKLRRANLRWLTAKERAALNAAIAALEKEQDMTAAYMVGYEAGRDSLKAQAEQLRTALLQAGQLLAQSAWQGSEHRAGDSDRYAKWIKGKEEFAAFLAETAPKEDDKD